MKIKFEFEKETKGTVRFKEVAEEPIVGTLYIKKARFKDLNITDKDCLLITIEREEK